MSKLSPLVSHLHPSVMLPWFPTGASAVQVSGAYGPEHPLCLLPVLDGHTHTPPLSMSPSNTQTDWLIRFCNQGNINVLCSAIRAWPGAHFKDRLIMVSWVVFLRWNWSQYGEPYIEDRNCPMTTKPNEREEQMWMDGERERSKHTASHFIFSSPPSSLFPTLLFPLWRETFKDFHRNIIWQGYNNPLVISDRLRLIFYPNHMSFSLSLIPHFSLTHYN